MAHCQDVVIHGLHPVPWCHFALWVGGVEGTYMMELYGERVMQQTQEKLDANQQISTFVFQTVFE